MMLIVPERKVTSLTMRPSLGKFITSMEKMPVLCVQVILFHHVTVAAMVLLTVLFFP